MKSYEIIARNIETIYENTGINSARFCKLCKDNGINITQSTLSRLLNGGNTSLETVDAIVAGLNLLDGYEDVGLETIVTYNAFSKDVDLAPALNVDNLSTFYRKLFIELDEIGWLKLDTQVNMQSIIDLSVHTFKKAGFEVKPANNSFKLKSGS